MSELSAYAFKPGSRIPKGVSITGLVRERDLIQKRMGRATTKLVTTAVERARRDYPSFAKFCTWDVKAGMRKLHEDEISRALSSIVIADSKGEPTPVKAFALVTDSEGEKIWQHTEIAIEDRDQRDEVLAEVSGALREATEKFEAYRKFMRRLRVVAA